jgi:predicted ferric reductase
MLTWIVARAAGFTAYGLLTGSVVLGLALGRRWRSPRWPRWATTELHRFVTLLTLVFLGLHVLLLALDGYMRFGLAELLVPLANHYRPLWTGLGVVAAWLALAVWASTWLQGRIGYRAWRRLHFATYLVYGAATLHGLQAGSDGHRPWALALYAGSALTVAGLTAARLAALRRPANRPARPMQRTAV